MPERWKHALSKIDRLAPSDDLLERAKEGPTRPLPGPGTGKRLGIVALAFTVAVAGMGWAFVAFRNAEQSDAPASETIAPGPLALWPELFVEDVLATQAKVEGGEDGLSWRLKPIAVAERFATDVLGWTDIVLVSAFSSPDLTGPGPVTMDVSMVPATCPTPGCRSPDQRPTVTLTLQQMAIAGEGGVWSVTAVSSLSIDLPVQPDAVLDETPIRAHIDAREGANVEAGYVLAGDASSENCVRSGFSGGTHGDGTVVIQPATEPAPAPWDCGPMPAGYVFVSSSTERLMGDGYPYDPMQGDIGGDGLIDLAMVPVYFSTGVTPTPSPTPAEAAPAEGYYIRFPDQPVTAEDDPNGGARVTVETNLPDGTRLATTFEVFGADRQGTNSSEGFGPGGNVKDGTATVLVDNSSCYNLVGAQGNSAGFQVTLVASPVDLFPGHGGPMPVEGSSPEPPPPYQPQSVYDALGKHFENLSGEGVTVEGKNHVLRVSRTYAWPSDSCIGTQRSFVPDECPPTQSQIQGDTLKMAMGEVMGAVGQGRLCELWQESLTPDAEAAYPWPGFRDRWLDWYAFHGPLASDAKPHDSNLDWIVIDQQGDVYTIELTLRGEPVVTLILSALPDWPGADKPGIVPFWGVEDFTLS